MLKRCIDFEKDFNGQCSVYDVNVKDVFGNKFYVVINNDLKEARFMSKNKDYGKRRRDLNDKNLEHVIISKWGDVIDLSQDTYTKIQETFPNVKLRSIQLLNIW